MAHIKQLDEQTIKQIAAGEVIERPASVVKELVENAIDAGASRIDVAVKQGGIAEIRVQDNGSGIPQNECLLAFQNHATSKLSRIDDLNNLLSMGFRGEALASIAAVSHVTLISKPSTQENAYMVELQGSEVLKQQVCAANNGTQFIVRNLFYNVPARYKFLKKDNSEIQAITRIITEEALAAANIAFTLSNNDKIILQTPGNNDRLSVIQSLFGTEVADKLLPIESDPNFTLTCSGYIGRADLTRKSRRMEYFFVNNRSFASNIILKAVEAAVQDYLMTRTFPVAFLFLDLPANLVDVNVHPRKLEVRFWNDNEVYRAVYHQVKNSFSAYLQAQATNYPPNNSPVINTEELKSEQIELPAFKAIEPFTASIPNEQDNSSNPATLDTPINPSEFIVPAVNNLMRTTELKENVTIYNDISAVASNIDAGETRSTTGSAAKGTIERLFNAGLERVDGKADELHKLPSAEYLGQLFLTYLLFACDNALYFVDQHAMHERTIYEKLCNAAKRQEKIISKTQDLLVPYSFTLCPADSLIISENLAELSEQGYKLQQTADGSFVLAAIPADQIGNNLKQLVEDLLQALDVKQGGFAAELSKTQRLLATKACRSAIMAHDFVERTRVPALLDAWLKCLNPFQCPHGRPVCLKLERNELEKACKRKV